MIVLLIFGALPFALLLLSVLPQLRRPAWLFVLSVSALVGAGCFLYVQKVLNSPDAGKEFQQLYLPLAAYGLIFVLGIAFAVKEKNAADYRRRNNL